MCRWGGGAEKGEGVTALHPRGRQGELFLRGIDRGREVDEGAGDQYRDWGSNGKQFNLLPEG